jgi:hypothetical protein
MEGIKIATKKEFERGDETYFTIGKMNIAQQWAKALIKNDKHNQKEIPKQYQNFADIFSEEAA